MYKNAGKFLNGLNGSQRPGRFSRGFTSSDRLGRQDRQERDDIPHWKRLARRLDEEVARVTPSHKTKKEYSDPRRVKVVQGALQDGKRVYLVAFALLRDPEIKFVKIGISSFDIRARFRPDLRNYKVDLLAESQRFTDAGAIHAEQAIHAAFRKSRRRPSIPLRSGNTECYAYSEENLLTFVGIVNSI
jgi:hypothetical protein